MGKYDLNEGNEALNRTLLIMKYNNKKTLTENKEVLLLEQVMSDDNKRKNSLFPQNNSFFDTGSNFEDTLKGITANPTISAKVEGSEKPQPEAIKIAEVYPIPGHIAYPTPTLENINGGVSHMYFPEKAEIAFWKMALPENFPQGLIDEKKGGKNYPYEKLTASRLNKILPPGTVRDFTITGETFVPYIHADKKTKGKWVFMGYLSEKTKKLYISPDPEEYKNFVEKSAEFLGTWGQIGIAVIVSGIVSYYTGGLGLPLARRLLYEVLAEAVVNAPFAYAEYKKGNNWEGTLSVIFSLLPYMDVKFLGLSKFKPDDILMVSTKLTEGLGNGKTIGQIYDSLEQTQKEIFSRIIQQDTRALGKETDRLLREFLADPTIIKPAWEKIILKDRDWWKNAGLQFSTAVVISSIVKSTTDTFDESEIKRLDNLITQAISNIEKNGNKLTDELKDKAMTEMTPEQADEIKKLKTVEDVQNWINRTAEQDPEKRAKILSTKYKK